MPFYPKTKTQDESPVTQAGGAQPNFGYYGTNTAPGQSQTQGYGYVKPKTPEEIFREKYGAATKNGNPYDDLGSQAVAPQYAGYGFSTNGNQSPYQFGGGYGGGGQRNVSDQLVPNLEAVRMQYLLQALGLVGGGR